MSLVTNKPFHNGDEPTIIVAPPDLQRAVTPLAHGVQEIMASLYRLQKSLNDAVAHNKQPHISVSSFIECRDIFRADWERYDLFLHQCHTYAGDYISLCEYVTTQPSTCLVFAKNILDMGTKIYEEVSRMLVTHRRTYRDLLTYATESSSGFPRLFPLTIKKRDSSANTDAHESITTSRLAQIIQSAKASVHPDGADVFSTIQAALREIETSLTDMKVFWKDQVDELATVTSKPNAIFMIKNLPESVKRWTRYDVAIATSITSILESSDAMLVNDIHLPTSPSATHTTPTIKYHTELGVKWEAAPGQQREIAKEAAKKVTEEEAVSESMITEKNISGARKASARKRRRDAKAVPTRKTIPAKEAAAKAAAKRGAAKKMAAKRRAAKKMAAKQSEAATSKEANVEAAAAAEENYKGGGFYS